MTIKTLICPSRRSGGPYGNYSGPPSFKNQPAASLNARADYAGSVGDIDCSAGPGGPDTMEQTQAPDWEGTYVYGSYQDLEHAADGHLLLLEFPSAQGHYRWVVEDVYHRRKEHADRSYYETGQDEGDDQNLYHGIDRDTPRFANAKITTNAGHRSGKNNAMQLWQPSPRRGLDGSMRRIGQRIQLRY